MGLCGSPFIDVFPLDGYPSDGFHYFLHTNKIKYYRALSKISVINRLHNRDRGFFENSIVKVSKILHLDKLLNTEKSIKSYKIRLKIWLWDKWSRGKCLRILSRERIGLQRGIWGSHNSLILKLLKSVVMLIRMLIWQRSMAIIWSCLKNQSKRSLWIHLGRISLKSFTMMGVRIDPLTMADNCCCYRKICTR